MIKSTQAAISCWRKQKVRLLVLAGRRKSGKDVFVEYVMKHYPVFKHYRIAEAPALIARILELPPDRAILHKLFAINKLLYPLLGESVYKRRVARLLDRERPRFAIVEAIRTKEEYEEFVLKRKGILIGITAENRLRYERALLDIKSGYKEKQDEGRMSFLEFMAQEKSPIEREIDWIIQHAHFIVENNYRTKRPLYRKTDALLRKLLPKIRNHKSL